jgi:transcriptional regulator with XRE-family HTH domain
MAADRLAKRIGKRLTILRQERGLTSERLAYENDVSKGYLSDIESGKKLPSLKMLEKLARALKVDIKELF